MTEYSSLAPKRASLAPKRAMECAGLSDVTSNLMCFSAARTTAVTFGAGFNKPALSRSCKNAPAGSPGNVNSSYRQEVHFSFASSHRTTKPAVYSHTSSTCCDNAGKICASVKLSDVNMLAGI